MHDVCAPLCGRYCAHDFFGLVAPDHLSTTPKLLDEGSWHASTDGSRVVFYHSPSSIHSRDTGPSRHYQLQALQHACL